MSVNLQKLGNAERGKLCRQYFLIGLACLPFVWLVNVIWFYRFAYSKEVFEEKKAIRFYVQASFAGLLVWTVLVTAWTIFFQMTRSSGAVWADYLTFVFPVGYV